MIKSLHTPRKRFGQHFLRDQTILDRIISAINPQKTEIFVEIGPGRGALTTRLLPQVKELHAIEIDRDLIQPLQDKCQSLGNLILHCQDVLTFDFSTLKRLDSRLRGNDNSIGNDNKHDHDKFRIVGNLPYNISTPLLFHLFEYLPMIQDMHFMFQKEVADRLTAPPDDSSYGRLSLMTQYYGKTEILFNVPASAFSPKPQVESSFIRFMPGACPHDEAKNPEILARIIKQAFSQRRKTLRNTLRLSISATDLMALGIDPNRRPQELTLNEYIKISNHIALL